MVDEGANHLFQKAKTGGVMEYASLEKAFVPDLSGMGTSSTGAMNR
jgi:hypothetical protein